MTKKSISSACQNAVKMKLPCVDCSVDTDSANEFYMVTDQVWHAAGMPSGKTGNGPPGSRFLNSDFLCIGCLESRLGRMLTPNDFTRRLRRPPVAVGCT